MFRVGVIPAAILISLVCFSEPVRGQDSLRVEGGTISYRVRGSGPALLLVHGLSTAEPIWDSAIPSLTLRHKVISVDLPGHGHSRNDRDYLDLRLIAADLHSLLDSLKIDRLSAIGHSGGAVVVLHMAAQRPARFSRVIVAAAPTKLLEPTRAALRFVATNKDSAHLTLMLRWHPQGRQQIERINRYTKYFAEIPASVVEMSEKELKAIDARVLIAHGDRDFLVPLEVATATFKSLRSAQLLVLPDADHGFLFPTLAPASVLARDLFWTTAERFLTSTTDNRALP